MHLVTIYVCLAISKSMVAALPLTMPFGGGLTRQSPLHYIENPVTDAIPTEQRNPAHHSATKEMPDDPPADQDADKDDNDDDEHLIPGDLLEGDSDSGGESDIGNDAVSVANGLLGSGGAGSAALNNQTSGSTAVFCSLFACASAAQSDGKVSTSASGATIAAAASGPLVSVQGPLVVINVSRARRLAKPRS
ncbi:hypothetical protein G3M48_001893 [Beauveria asiatica]|uniref:Secreted protein n=1 Tax=Beauveria asiatica TaxID=1069075 RepID=A0AAW0RFI6_9HYPO